MTNKLELHRAAQATAIKLLDPALHSRAKNDVVGQAFDDLRIDAKHFDEFTARVAEACYQFNALQNLPLEPVVNAPVTPA